MTQELGETIKSNVPAVNVPKRGLEEGVENEDVMIPRASLLQSLSPEIIEDTHKHLNLKVGQIINSLTKEVLPDTFIPIIRFVTWVRFNPRNKEDKNFDPTYDAGATIWRSNDPHDERVLREGKFGPNGEKPLATKFVNFLCYFPGVEMPIVISFSKTSFKAGKQLTIFDKCWRGDILS